MIGKRALGIFYSIRNTFLRILTRSPIPTVQSTLHALFLLTPFKYLSFAPDDPQKRALVCVESITIPKRTLARLEEEKVNGGGDGKPLGMEVWDNYERELKV